MQQAQPQEEYNMSVPISYSYDTLNNIREKIENMEKFNQVEVLRILTNHKNTIVNENKYGIHINLSELEDSVVKELEMYIKYVSNQEKYLDDFEKEKEIYKNTYFIDKDDADR